MIPILYTADETRFTTNGLGRLSDCTRCIVTEERNGIYECEFDYPLGGAHFDEIEIGRIVACTHDDRHDIQPFVIYSRSVPDLAGIVTFYAHHISYRLNDIVVLPYSAGSCVSALRGIGTKSVTDNPFTFWTDKSVVANFNNKTPRAARSMLAGEEGSILDVYGTGEYEFDKFDVKLHLHRGVDSGVEIRYAKNLIDLSQEINASGIYNAVVPYWYSDEGSIVMLPERILVFSGQSLQTAYLTDHNSIIIRTETDEPIEVSYSKIAAVPMDLTEEFEEPPTVSDLRAKAISRYNRSNAWVPTENITVSFVQLSQTEEYKEYAALQRVNLCDTVSVYYPQAGIQAVEQKVVRVVYDVLLDRYDTIELGELQSSLGEAIKADVLQDVPTTSMMTHAIQYASDLIRGGLGGYVVMTPGTDGYPQEILIMDTPDVNTAVNVWRFNQGGLGHSHNGYNGPFNDIALTQDGKINASMITAGILDANLIRAGTISDRSGFNYWDLASGQFTTRQGHIAAFDITDGSISYQSSVRQLTFDTDQIRYASTQTDGTTRGTSIHSIGLSFFKAPTLSFDAMEVVGRLVALTTVEVPDQTKIWLEIGGSTIAHWGEDSSGYFGCRVNTSFYVAQDFTVHGTKSREAQTDNYDKRLLYCYETPTPLFGDVGEAEIDEDGLAYVDIDDIFSETIADKVEYQVFLQKEGEGDCWIAEKAPRYFVIKGTPNLKVAWELKAKQKGYEMTRLEQGENKLDTYANNTDTFSLDSYINEQEALLYG